MSDLDLAAVKARYSAALDAKPSKGPVTRFDLLADSVADVPELINEVERLREAVKPATEYVTRKVYTTRIDDGGANNVRLVMRDLESAEAEVDRLRTALTDECRDIARTSLESAAVTGGHRMDLADALIGIGAAEVERLRTWKRREEVRVTLLSEAHDRAEATLARVEALADDWERDAVGSDADAMSELREALAGEQPAEPTETVDLVAALRDSLVTAQAERKKGEAVRALRSLSTDKQDTEQVHYEADRILLSVAPAEVAEAYDQLIEDIDGFWYA